MSFQGYSTAVSNNGSTILIGGPYDDAHLGGAWIFVQNSTGGWSQQGPKLVPNDYQGQPSFGTSVSLSSDGNTALIGGFGAAWIFVRSSDVWSQKGPKLVGTLSQGNAGQGSSVSLSGDGKTALVGGKYDNTFVGAAWIFIQNSTGDWTQQGDKLVGSGFIPSNVSPGAEQGCSVSLSYDGNIALIGGPYNNGGFGATWVFTRNSKGNWSQQGDYLAALNATSTASQGNSVSLSSDGNTALIGGPGDNDGAAWVYVTSTPAPNKQDKTGHPTTRYPSKSPTKKPTSRKPTFHPSKSPTKEPTTLKPTLYPSKSPTTRYPSKSPSPKPTKK